MVVARLECHDERVCFGHKASAFKILNHSGLSVGLARAFVSLNAQHFPLAIECCCAHARIGRGSARETRSEREGLVERILNSHIQHHENRSLGRTLAVLALSGKMAAFKID